MIFLHLVSFSFIFSVSFGSVVWEISLNSSFSAFGDTFSDLIFNF